MTAFSLAAQGIGLGLLPRIRIVHTHRTHEGQIYVPFVNWALLTGCIILVLSFGSSSRLASAYGLAVSGVMVATSLVMLPLARLSWKWSALLSFGLFGFFVMCDGSFLLANGLKLKATGCSNREIGRRLGIDEKAVRKRLRRLGWKSAAPPAQLALLAPAGADQTCPVHRRRPSVSPQRGHRRVRTQTCPVRRHRRRRDPHHPRRRSGEPERGSLLRIPRAPR